MIAAGGTGGHVYPALAAAESMIQLYPETQVYFVGTVDGFEKPLVEKHGLPLAAHDAVQAGPIHGVNPVRMVASLAKLTVGTLQAFRLLRKRRPQAILTTGGWVSLPIALVSWVLRVPLLVYLPDIEPGMTIKVLRRFANRVAITVPESAKYFRPGQTVVTGYPLREAVRLATREGALAHFGLDPQRRTLLVFGGSRGSRAINITVGDILPELLADGIQVIHITGTLDWERSQEQVKSYQTHADYHAFAYLEEIGQAFAAADLAICRAGASILGEFPYFGLPSILVPLAYSWHYQQVNADYLEQHGAAIHLPEERMQADLLETVRGLLGNAARLEEMQAKTRALAQNPDGSASNGAVNLAQALADLAGQQA